MTISHSLAPFFMASFVSNTLTDSGISIQTTKDDIRAGQGAPIQFSFYHDPSVEITLTDVLWKKEYVEAQLGADFTKGEHKDFKTDTVTIDANGEGQLKEAAQALAINCPGIESIAVWGAKKGTDNWFMFTYDKETHKVTLPADYEGEKAGEYCVRYFGDDARAMSTEISTQIIPQELYLIITAPLFAGDACAATKGKAAGHITFDVPRFQLNGAQDFQMNMSSNQTMSLSGIALASESADCNNNAGKLLTIRQFIDDSEQYLKNITDLVSDEETEKVGSTPVVYGILKDGTAEKVNNADLTFTNDVYSAETNKYVAEGQTVISLKEHTEINTAVTIAANE
jgi:hypothetical protein